MENDLQALLDARHHDPHRVLGVHAVDENSLRLRTYQPHAVGVETCDRDGEPIELRAHPDYPGLFETTLPVDWVPAHPEYTVIMPNG
ncbi:MAG TPA: hypothetical protein VFC95_01645, partial [Guyparkeria sp.]|nr:hypothetical protein [Guyparkeria sp.]